MPLAFTLVTFAVEGVGSALEYLGGKTMWVSGASSKYAAGRDLGSRTDGVDEPF